LPGDKALLFIDGAEERDARDINKTMKTFKFPYIALCSGLFFLLVVVLGGEANSDGVTPVPLLTLLVISEFAFFMTVAGAYIGVKHILSTGIRPVYTIATLLCGLLSVKFLLFGVDFWPL
jgi:hypothetical protein